MKTEDFNYNLPEELIAQEPTSVRDLCRMLVMDRKTGALKDHIFRDIADYLRPGDLLVANETRVMPARLLGTKRGTGGAAEVFLLRQLFGAQAAHYDPSADTSAAGSNQTAIWEVLVRPGKRLKPGSGAVVDFMSDTGVVVLSAEVIDWAAGAQRGERVARLSTPLPSLDEALHAVGHTPLPPYIKNYAGDEELYQTVYSRRESSAAAPTAGLHFTPELIDQLQRNGVRWETVELEVGLDTFRVIDEDDPEQHVIHTEFFHVPQRTVDAIAETRSRGGRVVAVGTTSVRSLESAWDATAAPNGTARPASVAARTGCGAVTAREREATSLYILPGFEFNVVDALITNFHVPKSTLMMLVSAFSSRENLLAAYEHAVRERYRLLSFGDAMFIC
ncbi:tRNA preQ1(34) S-adenosylmethionine ribosyltransferase-isomerase QueA [Adlercreutzia sp. ZJ141]|uniref:tRNA preQ1(34) S-adenosylmethionine ribosyltransferase-isomerase QueA n=1 Tax=Adlercreutzia sp. ZJ141 TaxID=2709406 RepID=UPI0013EAE421|nr:tRNA preQ1(34) S-adenosylmethionine ribosyltransferase-isomerase QueA [Adlercreutzia sp. ZJ141]